MINKIKTLSLFIVPIVVLLTLLIILLTGKQYEDTITYKGKTYVYLEYNPDIFTYNLNKNDYLEEDIIHPIEHNKWEVVYFNGDLFVSKKQVKDAIKYYSNDDNYEWSFIYEKDDYEKEYKITISDDELDYIYGMEKMHREETMLFEDIKAFGTIKKTSKDNFISAITTLAYYNDYWYWKTEVVTDEENNPEYVIKLPETLNNKINELLK